MLKIYDECRGLHFAWFNGAILPQENIDERETVRITYWASAGISWMMYGDDPLLLLAELEDMELGHWLRVGEFPTTIY